MMLSFKVDSMRYSITIGSMPSLRRRWVIFLYFQWFRDPPSPSRRSPRAPSPQQLPTRRL